MEKLQDTSPHAPDLDTGLVAQLASASALSPQQELGLYLSDRRESMHKSLDEISRVTKIPKTSLLHLESGRFGSLPGDVFVRGFLRSYARCLELDGDEVVSRYARCGLSPAPVSSELAETLLGSTAPARRPRRFPKATHTHAEASENSTADSAAEGSKGEAVKKVLRDAFDLAQWQRPSKVEKAASEESVSASTPEEQHAATAERLRNFVPPRLDFNDEMSHRGPLTLGVIILVIVATLTMSYLLRRPGTSVDGFTMAPASEAEILVGDDIAVESAFYADTLEA
jgi:hypothetical protein